MIAVLRQNIAKEAVANVDIVPGSWPDVHVETHDYSLAAHSVYGSADLPRFVERMLAAIERSLIAMMKTITDSPHGAELLDHKNTLAADLAALWRDRLRQSFRKAMLAEAKRNEVDLAARGLTADALADLLLDGLEGMKSRITDAAEQRKSAERLVKVIALSLQ